MHSLITVHTKYSVSLLWVCAVDAHTSPLTTENQFNVHWTNVFTAAKTISSIPILRAAERKAMPTEREYEVLFSLTPAHLHSKEKGTEAACLFPLQPSLSKLQAVSSRLDLATKKERKMAAKTVLCVCYKKKAEHLTLYEMWEINGYISCCL